MTKIQEIYYVEKDTGNILCAPSTLAKPEKLKIIGGLVLLFYVIINYANEINLVWTRHSFEPHRNPACYCWGYSSLDELNRLIDLSMMECAKRTHMPTLIRTMLFNRDEVLVH